MIPFFNYNSVMVFVFWFSYFLFYVKSSLSSCARFCCTSCICVFPPVFCVTCVSLVIWTLVWSMCFPSFCCQDVCHGFCPSSVFLPVFPVPFLFVLNLILFSLIFGFASACFLFFQLCCLGERIEVISLHPSLLDSVRPEFNSWVYCLNKLKIKSSTLCSCKIKEW